MNLYLDDSTEREYGIRFQKPKKKDLDDLRMKIRTAADMLGQVDPEELTIPKKGFLVEELTIAQRKVINDLLTIGYAQANEAQQRILQKIPIEESHDPMVSLEEMMRQQRLKMSFSPKLVDDECALGVRERMWFVRKKVANSFQRVVEVFNTIGLKPHIEDAFRPSIVQEGLLMRRVVNVSREFPQWTPSQVGTVSRSLTASIPGLAGHQAGAAIDLTLRRLHDDTPLPLGNSYPNGNAVSHLSCPYVTLEEYKTRMLFAHFMRLGGFRLLRTENWHASFGDRGLGLDGPVDISSAMYGPIQDFDDMTGAIRPYDPALIERPYLSTEEMKTLVKISRLKDEDNKSLLPVKRAVQVFRTYKERGGDWPAVQEAIQNLSTDSASVEEDDHK